MTEPKRMITEENIFTKGMLINLSMGSYVGRKKLAKEQMGELPTEIVRGVHDLFDKDFKKLLTEIAAFDGEIRWMVKSRSVPFPIDGVYFIKSEQIEDIIDRLNAKKGQRDEMIEKALEGYEEAIKIFAEKYPVYYEKAKHKYPSKSHFIERFPFKYQFLKIQAPGKEDKVISPEIYKLEMAKFKETIEDMKKEVISTIYGQLLETTSRLKKQCTEGKPSQRTLNTLNEYLQKIDDVYSDFVDRKDLKAAIKSVKAQVLGVTADELRDNDEAREKFRAGIADIVGNIKSLPDIPLKRAIEF